MFFEIYLMESRLFLLSIIILFLGWGWYLYIGYERKRQIYNMLISKERKKFETKVGTFIDMINEMRTPLSLILLPLEKLKDEIDERENKYILEIDKNINYLLEIINQLSDFQQLDSNFFKLNLKKHNINALVNLVLEQFRETAKLKKITLCLDLPHEEIWTFFDYEKVNRILVTLLDNAMTYAQSKIDLKISSITDEVKITVTDDGQRIRDNHYDKMFQAVAQLPSSPIIPSQIPRSDLEFAIFLAEAHHGSLSYEEGSSNGTSFVLSLPLENMEKGDASEKSAIYFADIEEEVDTKAESKNKKFTVLLVEDNADLLNLTRKTLNVYYRIQTAKNGKEALEILKWQSIDIIVCEAIMPEMDGIELCRQIKFDVAYSHIPVVLLTAKTTLESRMKGLECGADACIEKPFLCKQLCKQIENLLNLRLAFHEQIMRATVDLSIPLSDLSVSQKDIDFINKINAALSCQIFEEKPSMETFANQMNMSYSNLYRKMKDLFGTSPNSYIKNFRLNKAAELIANGAQVIEAAEQTGFFSTSHFAKCFKKKFGVLPKDYKH